MNINSGSRVKSPVFGAVLVPNTENNRRISHRTNVPYQEVLSHLGTDNDSVVIKELKIPGFNGLGAAIISKLPDTEALHRLINAGFEEIKTLPDRHLAPLLEKASKIIKE